MSLKTVDDFLSPHAVRESTLAILQLAQQGGTHFLLHLEKMSELSSLVVSVIRDNYPDLKIPYHSRWGHFKAGGPERLDSLFKNINKFDSLEQARKQIDLVIPSVLLDAGAGPQWQYNEASTQLKMGRSEGLGIASFYMFLEGKFSADKNDPFRSDAAALNRMTAKIVADSFQVTDDNPLVGLEGRAGLVQSLGGVVENHPDVFVGGRPGGLVDYLSATFGKTLAAGDILKTLLKNMGDIWPGRLSLDGVNLGDVWEHPKVGKVAFHKLSQWLTYSLLEPLEAAGFKIRNLDGLTGLAEYRNGGLFVDSGVLTLKEELTEPLSPDHSLIVEWRALTVQLLDQLAPMIRKELGLTSGEFPLAKVLEGGTWWTGRRLAKQLRPDGSPPIKIISDGTVF